MANVPDRSRGVKCFIISLAMAALAGCDGGPVSGQVVAVVDGEEITIPELNAEARARGLVIGTDRALRDRVLQDLIDRKLLVQAALDRKLDRTPDHLLAKRRSDEMLLANELIAALGRRGPGLTGTRFGVRICRLGKQWLGPHLRLRETEPCPRGRRLNYC